VDRRVTEAVTHSACVGPWGDGSAARRGLHEWPYEHGNRASLLACVCWAGRCASWRSPGTRSTSLPSELRRRTGCTADWTDAGSTQNFSLSIRGVERKAADGDRASWWPELARQRCMDTTEQPVRIQHRRHYGRFREGPTFSTAEVV